VFGALLLAGIVGTRLWWPEPWGIHRYDFLFGYALAIQVVLIACRLESVREFGVVIIFHAMATAMELFKTSAAIGSWSYPEPSVIRLGGVPLFAGFMYSAVGSYMARVWRIFRFRFENFPSIPIAAGLALLAYVNFFTHHYTRDIRWLVLVGIGAFFWRTHVCFTPQHRERRMHLLLGLALVALFIWIAENLGTVARAWVYPHQKDGWKPVEFAKISSWFLLMQLSFVLIYVLRAIERTIAPPSPTD
jgi:uncharacterized membrane protein YoaT (DUF817 family)